MKKLILVPVRDGRTEQIVLADFVKRLLGAHTATIFHISPSMAQNAPNLLFPAKRFAELLAQITPAQLFPLGKIVGREDIQEQNFSNLWKFLSDTSSCHVDTAVLAFPEFMFGRLPRFSDMCFHRKIRNSADLAELSPGQVGIIDFEAGYKTTDHVHQVEIFTDSRFAQIDSLPWQLLPDGYSSPTKTGENPREVLDTLILKWLTATTKENSWSTRMCKQIVKRAKKLSPYLSYPQILKKVS